MTDSIPTMRLVSLAATEYDCLDCGREFHSSEAMSFCLACEARHDMEATDYLAALPNLSRHALGVNLASEATS